MASLLGQRDDEMIFCAGEGPGSCSLVDDDSDPMGLAAWLEEAAAEPSGRSGAQRAEARCKGVYGKSRDAMLGSGCKRLYWAVAAVLPMRIRCMRPAT